MNKNITLFLDTNGNGTGTFNAIGNYSGVATSFYFQPASNIQVVVNSLIFSIWDDVTFQFSSYGNGSALTNGIIIRVTQNGEVSDFTSQGTIKTNFDLITRFKNYEFPTMGPALNTDSALTAEMNFKEEYDSPLILNGNTSDKIEVVLNDNFSGLNGQRFNIKGYIVE
jgi:hypothetical protein